MDITKEVLEHIRNLYENDANAFEQLEKLIETQKEQNNTILKIVGAIIGMRERIDALEEVTSNDSKRAN